MREGSFTERETYTEIDRKSEQLRERFNDSPALLNEFNEKLDFSWIYHDNALEGIVISYHELKAAIDKNIISDVTLIPAYTDIKNHKKAIDFIRDAATKRKPAITQEFLKQIFDILSENEITPRNAKVDRTGVHQFRKDNPLHRMYFHEIAPPDKIGYRLKKMLDWLSSDEARRLHPIKRASKAHFKLINIYPWPKHSGKIARLLMNLLLMRDGYLPSVIHAIERQHYYEVLRTPHMGLTTLVVESLSGTLDAAAKFIEDADKSDLKQAS